MAISQYPRPGMLPTKHPNSDKPKLRNIKIMGYTLRTSHYRYTLWVRFHAHNFSRGRFIECNINVQVAKIFLNESMKPDKFLMLFK